MNVLIADGSEMVTDRMRSTLQEIDQVGLLASASRAPATLEAIRRHDPEVLFVGVGSPGAKEIELLPTVRHEKANLNLNARSFFKTLMNSLGVHLKCTDRPRKSAFGNNLRRQGSEWAPTAVCGISPARRSAPGSECRILGLTV